MSNPFREDLVARSMAEPCTVVIFGATGDLTHRKLIPALYNLAVDGELLFRIDAVNPPLTFRVLRKTIITAKIRTHFFQ